MFLMTSLLLERHPEARNIFRLGILANGAGNPFHGSVVLFGMKGKLPHKVQTAGVVGIRSESALATDVRVEISSGSHMAETCLVELVGCICLR